MYERDMRRLKAMCSTQNPNDKEERGCNGEQVAKQRHR